MKLILPKMETRRASFRRANTSYDSTEQNGGLDELVKRFPSGSAPLGDRKVTSANIARSAMKGSSRSKAETPAQDGDDTETVLDVKEQHFRDYDETGQTTYENACRRYRTVPSATFRRKLAYATKIDMKHYGIGPRGAKALAIPMVNNTSITCLCLKGNDLSKEGIRYITRMLAENTSITELDLSDNNLGSYGAKLIAQMLTANTNLKKLDISGNRFGDHDAHLMVKSIENHPELKTILLNNNEFGEMSGYHFRHLLASNGHLQELDLSWNSIRARGGVELARGVDDNHGLKQLNMAWNGLGEEGAREMARSLGTSTLSCLDLTNNRIHDGGFMAIIKAVKDSDQLHQLKIGKNPISTEAATAALEFLHKIDDLRLVEIDMSECLFQGGFKQKLEDLKEKHPDFSVIHGYTDSYGKRKLRQYNMVEEALKAMKLYCEQHNLNIVELFSRFDTDGSMSVTHEEFREGLRDAKIPLSPLQVDELINALDQDGDGEIDFSELVLGAEMYDQDKS